MTTSIVRWNDSEARLPARVGGKAANLARLGAVPGCEPPEWFVLPVEVFRRHLEREGLGARVDERVAAIDHDDLESLRAAGAAVRDLVSGASLAPEDEEALGEALSSVFDEGTFLAVRSSAVGEDSEEHSFAGQLDSFLYVRGADEVSAAVRRCFASAWSDRALTYRHHHGLSSRGISVAVVVQRMVVSEVAGVLFTANPVTDDRGEMLVNATWGLGEGVVQGTFVTDCFRLPWDETRPVVSEPGEKDSMVVFDEERGTGSTVEEVPADRRDRPCLGEAQLVELRRLGKVLQERLGRPQDVEFAIEQGRIRILQTRAITTLSAGPEDGNRIVWDNSNIIESYCGVTSPLTFSFIRHVYSIVYDQFTQVMGVSAAKRAANQDRFRNMLGLIRGRVYYNLGNWYRLTSLFPGFDYNRDFMEQMMGVKERWEDDEEPSSPPSLVDRYLRDLPRLVFLCLRSFWNFFTIQGLMERFMADFDATYREARAIDLDTRRPHEIIRIYRDLEEKVLRKWKPPIMSDFFAMIFYGVLKKLITAWGIDEAGALQNDLICGEGGVESTEPPKVLMRLARRIAEDEDTRSWILGKKDDELVAGWRAGEAPEYLDRGLVAYLERYGERSMNELKLEEPSMRERPAFLFAMLRNYLRLAEMPDPDALHERELAIRAAAEAKVRAALGEERGPLFIKKSTWFFWVLSNARLNVKNRENQRFARTKIFSLIRDLFLALGRQLVAAEVLDGVDDVFYLEREEIFDFVGGTATCTDLRALARLRREEFARYRKEEADDRILTYGMVYHRNAFHRPGVGIDGPSADGVLRGLPCCPGVVRGPVRRILSPEDDMDLHDEILVAEKTDPGWIPLYPSASAILIERGSILSHSAIVAREMGIPTIVGIPGLVRAVQDGQIVEMDGAAGTVRLDPEGDGGAGGDEGGAGGGTKPRERDDVPAHGDGEDRDDRDGKDATRG